MLRGSAKVCYSKRLNDWHLASKSNGVYDNFTIQRFCTFITMVCSCVRLFDIAGTIAVSPTDAQCEVAHVVDVCLQII